MQLPRCIYFQQSIQEEVWICAFYAEENFRCISVSHILAIIKKQYGQVATFRTHFLLIVESFGVGCTYVGVFANSYWAHNQVQK